MSPIDDSNWNHLFYSGPHSYDTMTQLLPKALQFFENDIGGTEWITPSDFPEPILEWFKGQKYSRFYDSAP